MWMLRVVDEWLASFLPQCVCTFVFSWPAWWTSRWYWGCSSVHQQQHPSLECVPHIEHGEPLWLPWHVSVFQIQFRYKSRLGWIRLFKVISMGRNPSDPVCVFSVLVLKRLSWTSQAEPLGLAFPTLCLCFSSSNLKIHILILVCAIFFAFLYLGFEHAMQAGRYYRPCFIHQQHPSNPMMLGSKISFQVPSRIWPYRL